MGSQRWMVTSTSGPGGTPTTSVPNNLNHGGHHASAGGHAVTGGGSSTCGSDEDFKIFESSCELHGGDPYRGYPPTFECPEIYRALDGVRYIAECTMREVILKGEGRLEVRGHGDGSTVSVDFHR